MFNKILDLGFGGVNFAPQCDDGFGVQDEFFSGDDFGLIDMHSISEVKIERYICILIRIFDENKLLRTLLNCFFGGSSWFSSMQFVHGLGIRLSSGFPHKQSKGSRCVSNICYFAFSDLFFFSSGAEPLFPETGADLPRLSDLLDLLLLRTSCFGRVVTLLSVRGARRANRGTMGVGVPDSFSAFLRITC